MVPLTQFAYRFTSWWRCPYLHILSLDEAAATLTLQVKSTQHMPNENKGTHGVQDCTLLPFNVSLSVNGIPCPLLHPLQLTLQIGGSRARGMLLELHPPCRRLWRGAKAALIGNTRVIPLRVIHTYIRT